MGKKTTATDSEIMKIESRYQPGLLRQCINENLSADAMMERMGIGHLPTLRKHLLRLMSQDKQFYNIENLFSRGSNLPKVNPKGRLTLNLRGMIIGGREVVDGDLFQVRVEEDHIVLTRG
jgi:hypothetical protein